MQGCERVWREKVLKERINIFWVIGIYKVRYKVWMLHFVLYLFQQPNIMNAYVSTTNKQTKMKVTRKRYILYMY